VETLLQLKFERREFRELGQLLEGVPVRDEDEEDIAEVRSIGSTDDEEEDT
jgi:hypothetical protein